MLIVDRVSAATFIGREPELAELEASLRDAMDGNPRLVFIAGESGVGKSRLLSEFEHRATGQGARVIGGECIELGEDELPYAPLVGAIRPLARAEDPAFEDIAPAARAELARLAPELGSEWPQRGEDREGEAQRRLFDALLALLERLGRYEPVVFWLEDLHWADRSTRSFLAFLASSLRDERVLLIATYRSDELHRRHPLRPLLTEIERGPCARRLALEPFDRAELTAQLTDILGGPPPEEVVGRLFERTGGNPLFAEELLVAGLDGHASLPPTLRHAVLDRIEGIRPEARRVLDLLSVAGRADDATLVAAGSLAPAELRAGLREALDSHLIRADDSERFLFRHALFREAIYDDLLPGERSELHLAFARALSERSDEGVWLSAAIAHHFHKAGDQAEALRSAIEAADKAEQVLAFGQAASLLDRALELWPRVEEAAQLTGTDRVDLLSRAAHAHSRSGDDQRAVALFEAALEAVAPEDTLCAAGLLGDLAAAQWALGAAEKSREALARALELVPDEPTEQGARLLAHQVKFRLLQGRFGDLDELAGRAVAMCDALDLPLVKAGVLHRLGTGLITQGEVERGERTCLQAIEIARTEPRARAELGPAYLNYADALHVIGRSAEAAEIMDEAAPEIAEGDRAYRWLALQRAEVAFDLGHWEEAAEHLPSDRGLTGTTLVHRLIRAAEQALGRGDLAGARPLLARAADTLAGSMEPQFISALAALHADLELRERNVDAARKVIDGALDRIQYCTEDAARLARIAAVGVEVEAGAAIAARDVGDDPALEDALARAELMHARVEAAAEDFSEAVGADGEALADPVQDARLANATAELARARADAEAPERWAEASAKWRAAERPYFEARAAWRLAEALVEADRRSEASEAARTAHEIASRLGSEWLEAEVASLAARARLDLKPGAGPSGATEEPEDPFGLTERERQVLALVASGATNREIGEQLFMAEKTASVHVSRILGKLGVRSRTEAAAVAHRQGLTEAPAPPA